MINLIPLQYRFAAVLIGVALALSAAFSAGWAVNGWKKNSEHASELAIKNSELHSYDLQLVNQNSKVKELKIRKDAADAVLAQAELLIKELQKNAKSRKEQAAAIEAVDCTSMINKLKAIPR